MSQGVGIVEHMFDILERGPAPASPATADPISQIQAGIAELATEDRTHWTADSLSGRLLDLLETRDRLDAELARAAARWQSIRAWEDDGALSPVAWLNHRAPLTSADAAQLVKTGKVVFQCPQLAAALRQGRTTAAHVGALARVVSPRRASLLADHEEVLADQAEQLSIRDYTTLVRRWATIAEDHLAADNHGEHRPHNQLHAAITFDGWLDGNFRIDPVNAPRFLATLDHLAPPDPADAPDGVRSLAERRGDALADLASRYHQGGKAGANPPNIDVLVDVAFLNGDTPELARARCEVEGIGPVTRAALEQIRCGATLRRLVMAGESIVLDMGRRTRFATPAQARAVRIRDGGCIFPSCDRPGNWCEIHHVNGFAAGGRTDVARMVCLCTRHHTLIHNSKWTILINPDGTFTAHHPTRAP